ncbi:hypothetical protein ACFIQG_10220 [Comamonas odontotermitis]|uniref:hypothetical protein n=1 Tax=Comamonas odontotermitis TaxID=379895 RepID=UPI0036711DCD
MNQQIQAMSSYRAFVYPCNVNAWDLEGEEGQKLVDTIDFKAANGDDAKEKARWLTGKAVLRVERKD